MFQRSLAAKKTAAKNIELGEQFLVQNAKNDGVISTESGLQYQVLTVGGGSRNPKATDSVTVHYHGTLTDGTVFDSSVERDQPATFKLNQVIKGWTEGVQTMVVGEKKRFFIPANLAYGNRGVGSIPAGSVLIFDVELLNIQ
ncbi:FKBP-type peptidyl-prolyl cis-trans isomerase [Ferrimonas senticii]|uniref:FKBP-type peptidyl-prolyl cis-trans isomerase n=1 Tax=Ferrimonas senticii TaxID=394566 RepID=UPI001969F88F|nr:FKBP-type peptidyl-prolyl cis-trans isomerase [Ferrimonas senticii]